MDGIYRVSGIASNIKKLKALFDTQTVPEALEKGKVLFNLSTFIVYVYMGNPKSKWKKMSTVHPIFLKFGFQNLTLNRDFKLKGDF